MIQQYFYLRICRQTEFELLLKVATHHQNRSRRLVKHKCNFATMLLSSRGIRAFDDDEQRSKATQERSDGVFLQIVSVFPIVMKTDSVTLIISVPVHQQMKTWTRARKHTKSFTYIINLHTTPPKKKMKELITNTSRQTRHQHKTDSQETLLSVIPRVSVSHDMIRHKILCCNSW